MTAENTKNPVVPALFLNTANTNLTEAIRERAGFARQLNIKLPAHVPHFIGLPELREMCSGAGYDWSMLSRHIGFDELNAQDDTGGMFVVKMGKSVKLSPLAQRDFLAWLFQNGDVFRAKKSSGRTRTNWQAVCHALHVDFKEDDPGKMVGLRMPSTLALRFEAAALRRGYSNAKDMLLAYIDKTIREDNEEIALKKEMEDLDEVI